VRHARCDDIDQRLPQIGPQMNDGGEPISLRHDNLPSPAPGRVGKLKSCPRSNGNCKSATGSSLFVSGNAWT
jgi:hypothetical protein